MEWAAAVRDAQLQRSGVAESWTMGEAAEEFAKKSSPNTPELKEPADEK